MIFIAKSDIHAEEQKLTIQHHFTEGQSFNVVEYMDFHINTSGMKSLKNMETSFGVGFVFRVDKVFPDGAVSGRFIIHSISANVPGFFGNQNYYDSTNPFQIPDGTAIAFGLLAGTEFEVGLNADGDLTQMKLSNADIQRIAKQLSLDGKQKESLTKALDNGFRSIVSGENEDIINAIMENPVAIGETRTKTIEITKNSLSMNLQFSYTLKSRHDGVASFEIDAKILSVNNESASQTLKFSKFDGTMTGTTDILEDSGWVRQSEIKLRFQGEIKKENQSGIEPDEEEGPVTFSLDGVFTIKTLE
jgi:hypothetical protein